MFLVLAFVLIAVILVVLAVISLCKAAFYTAKAGTQLASTTWTAADRVFGGTVQPLPVWDEKLRVWRAGK